MWPRKKYLPFYPPTFPHLPSFGRPGTYLLFNPHPDSGPIVIPSVNDPSPFPPTKCGHNWPTDHILKIPVSWPTNIFPFHFHFQSSNRQRTKLCFEMIWQRKVENFYTLPFYQIFDHIWFVIYLLGIWLNRHSAPSMLRSRKEND